jgi:hypothetical protein
MNNTITAITWLGIYERNKIRQEFLVQLKDPLAL